MVVVAPPTDPILFTEPIIDQQGRPTAYFMRQWLSQRGVNDTSKAIIEELNALVVQVLANIAAISAIQNIELIAGVGLEGGGDLSGPDRTFDLEDTDVDAGSFTSADITVDAQGRITAAASGGGGGGAPNVFHVQDQKASGTSAGSSVVGNNIRVFNTSIRNTIVGASLAANQLTFAAVTYEIMASAPMLRVKRHQVSLYDVTAAATLLLGNTAFCVSSDNSTTDSTLNGQIVLAVTTVLELRHWAQLARSTFGLGLGNSTNPAPSVFADMYIRGT